MHRRNFLASLIGAATMAGATAISSAPINGSNPRRTGELVVTIECDTSAFTAAMDRAIAEMEKWESPPTAEEFRAQMEGMPPIKLMVDGRVIDEVYVAL
jgi:hypothetical protein